MTIDNITLERLLMLLDKAEKLAGQFTGGYSDHFHSAQDFHIALRDSIYKLRLGDTEQLNDLWLWFTPSYDWDDFTNDEGGDLANEIYPILTELYLSQSSMKETKLADDKTKKKWWQFW